MSRRWWYGVGLLAWAGLVVAVTVLTEGMRLT